MVGGNALHWFAEWALEVIGDALRWHARIVTGKFFPVEMMRMLRSAVYPHSGADSDSESDWMDERAVG